MWSGYSPRHSWKMEKVIRMLHTQTCQWYELWTYYKKTLPWLTIEVILSLKKISQKAELLSVGKRTEGLSSQMGLAYPWPFPLCSHRARLCCRQTPETSSKIYVPFMSFSCVFSYLFFFSQNLWMPFCLHHKYFWVRTFRHTLAFVGNQGGPAEMHAM